MKKIFVLFLAIMATGCAQMTGYTPVVDQAPLGYGQGDLYQQNQLNSRLDYDRAQCHDLAKRAANTTQNIATDTIAGGLIGAAGGAIVGAFTGNPAAGAAMGAAAGGFGGAAKGGLTADQQYKQAFDNCLAGRGHRVVR